MQYHLDGFRPGDPSVAQAVERDPNPADVDVLIVGCGPAGLTLAAQLAAFPSITTRIVDQKLGPLEIGQADGVACRSMEMFQAFGFADRVAREAYWVNETSFWRPSGDEAESIVRVDRIQDVEDGLSEFPHTILSQARIHDFYLEAMRRSPRRLEPHYGHRFTGLTTGGRPDDPVTVTLERLDAEHHGEVTEIRARYVVGCDGARSAVRASLGRSLVGDSANKLWGVMDVLAVTDFPDIRLKCAIQSATAGSMLIIPREGGYLVRIYTELGELGESERARDRNLTLDELIEAARKILAPYTLDVKEVAWWSAYEIGQRLADSFDDAQPAMDPHVFIVGDACHTHSPKAGQGMNVSMADSFNLGWKLASVLQGRSAPELLRTYTQERQAVAAELIDFDRDMATLFSARSDADADSDEQAEFQRYFAKHGRYTAGVETRYDASMITGSGDHQGLATGLVVGMRFHSAPAVRVADAKTLQLGHVVTADGRWRLFLFAADTDSGMPGGSIGALCDFLSTDERSPVRAYRSPGDDVDAVIDVRAVFTQPHRELAVDAMPSFLLPRKGALGLIDYEKIFTGHNGVGPHFYDARGIDRSTGCMVIVRPDHYVADVLPLDAHAALADFFDSFMRAETAVVTAVGDEFRGRA